jgi:hypothetical protein
LTEHPHSEAKKCPEKGIAYEKTFFSAIFLKKTWREKK